MKTTFQSSGLEQQFGQVKSKKDELFKLLYQQNKVDTIICIRFHNLLFYVIKVTVVLWYQ